MEARVRLPGSGSIVDWPAFWAVGQSWPTDGEIDVVEGLGGQACAHFINHPGRNPGTCATGAFAGQWHIFAADWEPGSVAYYYDGIEIFRDTLGITSAPMCLVLDLAVSDAITSPDTAPATMQVDYVTAWQH
jgi:beta-glucanase (GH16 family)